MKKTATKILAWASRAYGALRSRQASPEVNSPMAEMMATIASLKAELEAIKSELQVTRAELETLKIEQSSAQPAQPSAQPAQSSVQPAQPVLPSFSVGTGSSPVPQPAPQKCPVPAKLGSDRSAMVRFNEQFLSENYDLRYNILKRATEFRRKGTDEAFQPLTERDLNHLTVEQLKAGGGSWSYAMRLCIDSSAVPSYNPVRAYLDGCPQWDGHDHIGDLAQRVPTSYADWPRYFHRWLLSMVAQAMGMGGNYGNSMVPLLIGGQGLKKSTFCRCLLPPELREYFMDDIKMDSAEQVERVLARMWLVCIDEYNAKTPREQAKIKRLLTEKDVQVRRPRSEEYRLTPRLASFIATTNDPTPLPSGDGTRRYLCVEVEGAIDLPGSTGGTVQTGATDGTQTDAQGGIDHRQLFAQALAELRQEGCVWWFTAEDEAAIQEHNRPYQQLSPLEELLPALFEPTTDRRRENLWQVQAVQKVLAQELRTADVPNLHQIASAMKALRWPQGATNGLRGYYLKECRTEKLSTFPQLREDTEEL